MVAGRPLAVAIAAASPLLASAFAPPPQYVAPLSQLVKSQSQSWVALSAGKGFGEKPPTKQKASSSIETGAPESSLAAPIATQEEQQQPKVTEDNTGSKKLRELRSREAERRNEELQKIRALRETDAALREDAGAAAIPEKVAQRMGKRMIPFVGIPLFGTFASFIGFWYMAVYKDMEFQPALVATTSFVFLAIGLLGITYSVLSASWDDDREGSTLGLDEFQTNVNNLKDGLARTKENALLRERMAGLSEDEIQRAIDDQERREAKKNNKKDAWME
ncbi:hypothetical protein ACHAXM_009095 [Skeletonema potamos]|jgi:hypothetical protein